MSPICTVCKNATSSTDRVTYRSQQLMSAHVYMDKSSNTKDVHMVPMHDVLLLCLQLHQSIPIWYQRWPNPMQVGESTLMPMVPRSRYSLWRCNAEQQVFLSWSLDFDEQASMRHAHGQLQCKDRVTIEE